MLEGWLGPGQFVLLLPLILLLLTPRHLCSRPKQPYFAAPDFNYESAKKASGNVAGLCNWAESMCKYHEVAKVVEPKIAKLHEAEAELRVATKERTAVEEELAVVQGRLDEMQAKFDAAMAQKQVGAVVVVMWGSGASPPMQKSVLAGVKASSDNFPIPGTGGGRGSHTAQDGRRQCADQRAGWRGGTLDGAEQGV